MSYFDVKYISLDQRMSNNTLSVQVQDVANLITKGYKVVATVPMKDVSVVFLRKELYE